MPYVEKLALEGADAAAIGDEVHGLLDGALAAHPKWTKVTDGYTGNSLFGVMDVWKNDGTTDGYEWYLVVAKGNPGNASYAGRVLLGGALEYDPATNIAKKAMRGWNTAVVDADGYPVVSAGGAEREYPLTGFKATNSAKDGLLGGSGTKVPTAPVAGSQVRVLVTGQVAWFAWGTPTTLTHAHGVGTYTNMHSATLDQRPLAFMGCTNSGGADAGTVWQHPAAVSGQNSAANDQFNSSIRFVYGAASNMYGQVGGYADLLYGGPIGARLAAQRFGYNTKELSASSRPDQAGGFLGLSPADFLVFGRANGCQIGDTVTVDGKTYVSVDTPSAYPSLFVNTQPDD